MRFPAKITSSCIWVAIPDDWVTLHWHACGADGRSVGRCTVTWLPDFLGWVDHYIFLPMVLCWRASRARAPLLCLECFSWFLFLLVIPVRFKGTVKRVKKRVTSFATFLQHELNSDDVAGFATPRRMTPRLLAEALLWWDRHLCWCYVSTSRALSTEKYRKERETSFSVFTLSLFLCWCPLTGLPTTCWRIILLWSWAINFCPSNLFVLWKVRKPEKPRNSSSMRRQKSPLFIRRAYITERPVKLCKIYCDIWHGLTWGVCTGRRAGVRYVITKFSRMDSLPNFITHGAPLWWLSLFSLFLWKVIGVITL